MGRTRPAYPKEFRVEAVRLYLSSGKSYRVISEELGVALETLRSWVKQYRVDAGEAPGLSTEEREELRRLRREYRTLREEREILKKAAAFFAKESETR